MFSRHVSCRLIWRRTNSRSVRRQKHVVAGVRESERVYDLRSILESFQIHACLEPFCLLVGADLEPILEQHYSRRRWPFQEGTTSRKRFA